MSRMSWAKRPMFVTPAMHASERGYVSNTPPRIGLAEGQSVYRQQAGYICVDSKDHESMPRHPVQR